MVEKKCLGPTLNFASFVHRDESIHIFWRFKNWLQSWIKKIQHGSSKLETNLLGAEIAMSPIVGIVDVWKLGQRTCCSDGHVIGMEIGINHKLPIINKACIIHCLKGVVIHSLVGEIKKGLKSIVCHTVTQTDFAQMCNLFYFANLYLFEPDTS